MSKPSSSRSKLARLSPPRFTDESGCRYYLDNVPARVPGRDHVVFAHRSSPPKPLFAASPSLRWRPPEPLQRSSFWGAKADRVRAAINELVSQTARELNVRVVEDEGEVDLGTGRVVGRSPLNVLHVREVDFIAGQIVAAARLYHEWSLAWSETLCVPRTSNEAIAVTWQTYGADTTNRLRRLQRAAERGTGARLELKWQQTPAAGRHFVWRAAAEWPHAARYALIAQSVEPGNMISATMPSRAFLLKVLPEAITLSASKRGRRVLANDVFLAAVREMFLMLVGDDRDRLRVGRFEVPTGAGADFVRGIEEIFSIRLLDGSSRHAIKRARELADFIGVRRARPERLK